MYRAITCLVLTLALPAVVPLSSAAQSAPDGFPLAAGTYWIYEGTLRLQDGDDRVRVKRARCRMEINRTIHRDALSIAVVEGYPDEPALDEPESTPGTYLIVKTANNDFYFCKGVELDQVVEASTDPERLLNLLLECSFLVLELPLIPGTSYAPMEPDISRDDTWYAWHVDSRKRACLAGVRGISRSRIVTKYQIALRTASDHTIIEFVPGIGITRYTYSHHGSVMDVKMRLVQYHRAASVPGS